jgi:ABC-2 type transport system permease protein
MDLLWFLRDAKYCLLHVASNICSATAAIISMFLLAGRVGGVAGMSRGEILFMLSYGLAVDGLYVMVFENGNIGVLSRMIGQGRFDQQVIQPVPYWMQLLSQGLAPFSGNVHFICGVGLLVFSSGVAGVRVTYAWAAVLTASLILSCAVMASAIWWSSALAFYAPAAAEDMAEVTHLIFSSTKIFPMGGLGLALRLAVCSVLPIGLTAWFPSLYLLGRPLLGNQYVSVLFLVAITAIFTSCFIFYFRKGMEYYAKNGSPRYTGFGHR